MKRCPQCNRTYADETLAFCLADGALLSAPFDPNETLRFPPPPPTLPAAMETWPAEARRAAESPRTNKWNRVVVGLLAFALIIAGGIAIWLVLQKRGSTEKTENASSATTTPSTNPSPLPSPSLSAEKSLPRLEASPVPTTTTDLSYLTGTYDLYALENPSDGSKGTMSLKVRKGNDIFVRGTDWTGTGRIDGKQGYYDWKFEDGKYGRTTILVNDNGTLQGRVFGSGIDWWYLARKQR